MRLDTYLKDELEADHVGFTILELEPDGEGKEHDETETGQEEIYYVVAGEIEVELTDAAETVALAEDQLLRLDPEVTRKIVNRGEERAKVVLVGAPL
ncbi:cupin domain-containing protein [Natrarchaeobius chitinivorans]|uniref:Cupin domain-containing protein n=1 Tax=Natrarchaeobius chitinivorans TaxID=1679083 RepID=A0A3N6MJS3_NATCH|nr:cupin domain-containing protein [Natrarchaeobius chitinivorans]